MLLYKFTTF